MIINEFLLNSQVKPLKMGIHLGSLLGIGRYDNESCSAGAILR